MRQDQKSLDEYHKWDKEFCTDAAPTYWECWQAACATMQKQISRLEADFNDAMIERNNAEKREYEVLGRANALEAELKATQARLDASDELLREEFAQRQDALATLRDIGDFAHDRSTGPAVEDGLWEVRRMAYELLTSNA
ncbi:MAG: hypothetical protein KKC18_08075 [Chloroflexi bacterium]|nr:hypothetical protein [Chloroflexota bacterium]